MVFKIILSVVCLLSTGFVCGKVGQLREPLTGGDAWLTLILNGLLVYGLWFWC